MNTNSCQAGNMHSEKKAQLCDSADYVINDWAKILDNRGQVDT